MATISITRKIEFNESESRRIAKAITNVEKLTVKENPQKISKRDFLKRITSKK